MDTGKPVVKAKPVRGREMKSAFVPADVLDTMRVVSDKEKDDPQKQKAKTGELYYEGYIDGKKYLVPDSNLEAMKELINFKMRPRRSLRYKHETSYDTGDHDHFKQKIDDILSKLETIKLSSSIESELSSGDDGDNAEDKKPGNESKNGDESKKFPKENNRKDGKKDNTEEEKQPKKEVKPQEGKSRELKKEEPSFTKESKMPQVEKKEKDQNEKEMPITTEKPLKGRQPRALEGGEMEKTKEPKVSTTANKDNEKEKYDVDDGKTPTVKSTGLKQKKSKDLDKKQSLNTETKPKVTHDEKEGINDELPVTKDKILNDGKSKKLKNDKRTNFEDPKDLHIVRRDIKEDQDIPTRQDVASNNGKTSKFNKNQPEDIPDKKGGEKMPTVKDKLKERQVKSLKEEEQENIKEPVVPTVAHKGKQKEKYDTGKGGTPVVRSTSLKEKKLEGLDEKQSSKIKTEPKLSCGEKKGTCYELPITKDKIEKELSSKTEDSHLRLLISGHLKNGGRPIYIIQQYEGKSSIFEDHKLDFISSKSEDDVNISIAGKMFNENVLEESHGTPTFLNLKSNKIYIDPEKSKICYDYFENVIDLESYGITLKGKFIEQEVTSKITPFISIGIEHKSEDNTMAYRNKENTGYSNLEPANVFLYNPKVHNPFFECNTKFINNKKLSLGSNSNSKTIEANSSKSIFKFFKEISIHKLTSKRKKDGPSKIKQARDNKIS